MSLATELKDRIKRIAARSDVRVDYKVVGRAIKKPWPLDYARDEHGLPSEIVDLYADLNGLQFAWRGNGLVDDPRGRARGLFTLRKLEELMWFDAEGFEVMRLQNDYSHRGLLLIREGGAIRAVHSRGELKDLGAVRELGSFTEMITEVMGTGFLPFELYDAPVAEAVRTALSAPAPKRKVEVGSRVFGAKVKTEGFGLSRRGTVSEITKADNGKRYALVDWDLGDRSYARLNLLAGLGEDAYERLRQAPLTDADPAAVDPLLDQMGSDTSNCLYQDLEEARPVRLICESVLWLTDLGRRTPLPDLLAWVNAQLDGLGDLPDQDEVDAEANEGRFVSARVDIPLTGTFGGGHLQIFHTSRDTRRRARALIESVVLRWFRDPEGVGREVIETLVARVGMPKEDDPTLGSLFLGDDPIPELGAKPRYDDDEKRARDLGLSGAAVYYTHD